ncbi:unnamed protein product, partial [Rotaria sordida]
LVKHALKTIIHSLTQNDRLSIVSFANSAQILFKLHQMDDDGRSSALAALERLNDNLLSKLYPKPNVLIEHVKLVLVLYAANAGKCPRGGSIFGQPS